MCSERVRSTRGAAGRVRRTTPKEVAADRFGIPRRPHDLVDSRNVTAVDRS
jgi:hypothetical protein